MSPTIIAASPAPDGVASPTTVTASPVSLSNATGVAPPVLSPLSQAGERDQFGGASDSFFKTTPFLSLDAAPSHCSNCGHAREDAFGLASVPTLTDAHT